jgi:hypothetical protein
MCKGLKLYCDKNISISSIRAQSLYNSFSFTSKYIAFAYLIDFVAPLSAKSSAPCISKFQKLYIDVSKLFLSKKVSTVILFFKYLVYIYYMWVFL